MCLTTVYSRFKPNDKMQIGYKIYKTIACWDSGTTLNGNLQLHNPYFYMLKPVKIGCAYSDKNTYEITYEGGYCGQHEERPKKTYETGFHIYETLRDARIVATKSKKICEVLAWDIRVRGKQYDYRCFVAKNYRIMRILK
jgi:hypothetical protein